MRRADRRDESYHNSINNPRSHQPEPVSPQELKTRLNTVTSQRDEWQQEAQKNHQLYLDEQQNYQSAIVNYQEAQSKAESYLSLYNAEKTTSSELLVRYKQAEAETRHYIVLYNEAQTQLKFERRSKAGIKGWETRRKRENEQLKQEIGEMTILLRDSLARKDEAIDNLEALADRMDRLQYLIHSVEGESSDNPVNVLQKMARIWQAIKDILAE